MNKVKTRKEQKNKKQKTKKQKKYIKGGASLNDNMFEPINIANMETANIGGDNFERPEIIAFLRCGHIFRLKSLINIIANYSARNPGERDSGTFKCPTCMQTFILPTQFDHQDVLLITYSDYMNSFKKKNVFKILSKKQLNLPKDYFYKKLDEQIRKAREKYDAEQHEEVYHRGRALPHPNLDESKALVGFEEVALFNTRASTNLPTSENVRLAVEQYESLSSIDIDPKEIYNILCESFPDIHEDLIRDIVYGSPGSLSYDNRRGGGGRNDPWYRS